MLKIRYKKSYKDKSRGDTETVGNNEAHTLIELGVAEVSRTVSGYQSKVMTPSFTKRYKTKGK